MALTPLSSLPYPVATDPPNGPLQIQNLAVALDGRVPSSATPWTSFTPSWGAVSTPPVLGNGTLTGFYQRVGRMITFSISLTFGSTTNAGTGGYTFGVPATSAAREQRVMVTAYAAGLNLWAGFGIIPAGAVYVEPYLPANAADNRHGRAQSAAAGGAVGTGVPNRSGDFSYKATENLFVHGAYEAAS